MIAVVMAPLMLFFAVEELSQSTDDAPTWMSSLGRLESEQFGPKSSTYVHLNALDLFFGPVFCCRRLRLGFSLASFWNSIGYNSLANHFMSQGIIEVLDPLKGDVVMI